MRPHPTTLTMTEPAAIKRIFGISKLELLKILANAGDYGYPATFIVEHYNLQNTPQILGRVLSGILEVEPANNVKSSRVLWRVKRAIREKIMRR
jgi:hypothetical protein